MQFQEGDSGAYWDSDAWNPDDRVYVGASAGQTHHLRAVEPDAASTASTALPEKKATQAWGQRSSLSAIDPGSGDYWEQMRAPVQQFGGYPQSVAQPAGEAKLQSGGSLAVESTMQLGSEGSSRDSYWDDYGDPQPGRLPDKRATPFQVESQSCNNSTKQDSLQNMRVGSGAYWDADQWDPDNRVYVGAEAGQVHHLQAVDPKDTAEQDLWRVWAGGLASTSLGLATEVGPPMDLKAANKKASLQDVYEIGDESVGSGSFGVVRKSRHKVSGTNCVIKSVGKLMAGERYRSNLVDDGLGEKLLRMSREARHPNIALYLDMIEGAKNFYVIMEELAGAELMDQVEEMFPVTEAYLQRVMKHIFQGLSHIHGKVGLVHRDVKLSNFRFRSTAPDADLALLDFGFARDVRTTWDGAVCGTMMFMAPEVVGSYAAVPHLAAIDNWAAGVILYVLLTGDSPAQEEEVRLMGRKGKEAEANKVLEKALGASELSKASAESLALLRQLLVLDPGARATAATAMEHTWFSTHGEDRKIGVQCASKYRLMRSNSKMSQSSRSDVLGQNIPTPKGKGRGKVKSSLAVPSARLERIVSEGVEELKD